MNIGVHTGLLDFKGMAKIATGDPSPPHRHRDLISLIRL
jgi:hypothetical protein